MYLFIEIWSLWFFLDKVCRISIQLRCTSTWTMCLSKLLSRRDILHVKMHMIMLNGYIIFLACRGQMYATLSFDRFKYIQKCFWEKQRKKKSRKSIELNRITCHYYSDTFHWWNCAKSLLCLCIRIENIITLFTHCKYLHTVNGSHLAMFILFSAIDGRIPPPNYEYTN